MPARRSCSFCGNDIEPGTGKMFIKKDGTIFLFCSSKCQANLLKLGRVPRWTPWTQAFRRATALAAVEAAPELVVEGAPVAPGTSEAAVVIETPKGKDLPADLVDLIDKRLGPDLSRGDIERYFGEFVAAEPFRHSIVNASKKSHAGKVVSRIEKGEFLAWKDSADGRRVFKAWLDARWATVKGRAKGEAREEQAHAPAPVKKKKKAG